MFHKEARDQCHETTEAFVECSKANGLMVVLRCREENTAMNACTHKLTSDEHWKEYRRAKIVKFMEEGKLTTVKSGDFTDVL